MCIPIGQNESYRTVYHYRLLQKLFILDTHEQDDEGWIPIQDVVMKLSVQNSGSKARYCKFSDIQLHEVKKVLNL